MTWRRLLVLAFFASIGSTLFTTRVVVGFDAVRVKTVRQPTVAAGGAVEVTVSDDRLAVLQVPFALISRVRNDSSAPQEIAFYLDGARVCTVTIAANTGRRVDCAVTAGWALQSNHDVVVRGATSPWTLEYLELATHYGSSTSVVHGFVLPRSRHFRGPGVRWSAVVWLALALLLVIEPRGGGPRAARVAHRVILALLTAFVAAILLSPLLSPYIVVISPGTFGAIVVVATWPRTWPTTRRMTVVIVHAASRLWTWAGRRQQWLAVTGAFAVTVVTGVYGTRAAGGADEYGYLSQAELWLRRDVTIEQPFVADAPWPQAAESFSPLGYRPHPTEPTVIVPSYSAGLPMLLGLAKLVGGQEAMFWVVPLSAGLLVLATYFIGMRLRAETAGLTAALLVATSPTMLFMATSLMSDVPVATAWAWSFYLLLGSTLRAAAGAGLLSAIAVLIRPNLLPLAGVLAMHYGLVMRQSLTRRRAVAQALVYSAALLPGVTAVAFINAHLYGSPLSSGYGDVSGLFALSRVPTNLRLYLLWLAQAHTPVALLGVVALLIPLRRLWPTVRDRSVFVVMGAFVVGVWGIYSAWLVFDLWWFSRFMLSSWPFIMLGVGSITVALHRYQARDLRAFAILLVMGLTYYQCDFTRDRGILRAWQSRLRFVAMARLVRQLTAPNSVILSVDHSGSVRYYGGRMTIMFRALPDGALDMVVDWSGAHGAHPYLVIDDGEWHEFTQRFAGTRALRVLESPPLAQYRWTATTRLYDLMTPSLQGHVPVDGADPEGQPTVGPVEPPRLVFSTKPE